MGRAGSCALGAVVALGLAACGDVRGGLEVPGAEVTVSSPAPMAAACPDQAGAPAMAGTGPLTLSPARYDFVTVAAGQSSATRKFVVTNAGAERAAGLQLAISDGVNFPVIRTDCPSSLDAATTCSIEIAFRPHAPGRTSAWLTVASAGGGQSAACLAGTGN